MTFIEETMKSCMDLWTAYLEHPFLKDIRSHKMSETMFLHYLKEDTKYLKEYARVFGMGIFKSTSMDEMMLFYEMLKFVEANETAARVTMLNAHGYDVREIEQEDMAPATKDYSDFLMQTATQEGPLEMLFATLPCMLSYAYIGERLQEENPRILEESPYRDWIREYVSIDYRKKCKDWMACAEAMLLNYDEQKKMHLRKLFREASIHEMHFWDMSYQLER